MPHEQDLEATVRWLADIEQIKQLKARYALACDDSYDPDALAELFAEDAVWDGGFMGHAETREGIREFFANASSVVAFAVHGVSNPLIEVDGDRASGRWYLDQPMVLKDGENAFWFCAQYEDAYVRGPEGWLFRSVKILPRAFTPYDEGFGRQLFAQLPGQGDQDA